MVDYRESPFGLISSVGWGQAGIVFQRTLRTSSVCADEQGPYIIVLGILLAQQVTSIGLVTGVSSGQSADLTGVPNDGLNETNLPAGYPALWVSPVSQTYQGKTYRTLIRLFGGEVTSGDPLACDYIFGPNFAWELNEAVTAEVTLA